MIGKTDKGLAWLGFMVDGYKGNGLVRMKKHFPYADFVKDDCEIEKIAHHLIQAWEQGDEKAVTLDLQGTNFQKSVWSALLDITRGNVVSYGDIAHRLDKPNASRAVGSAVGENPVSLIVPCHRVLQKSGKIGNYGWGVYLKQKILNAEGVAC